MKKSRIGSSVIIMILVNLLLPDASLGDPRAQVVQIVCGNQLLHNATIFMPNFVQTMENLNAQVPTSGFGTAVGSSGLDNVQGLVQCYGDLSLQECVLCFARARTVIHSCYPFNSAKVYLDGCFLRTGIYNFFQEYSGQSDTAVCGNRTQKSFAFQVSARQAVVQAVSAAPNNNGYARSQVPVSRTNESAYVLANCWRTLSASSCRACLQNASASILGCLPWSEGRAVNTGCFLRYSDTNFLNPIPRNGSSRGKLKVIIVAAVSSTIVLVIGAVIGVYIWKHRTIQKKRKGWGDAKKLAKTLHDGNLNFKYSTLEKSTDYFNEANKLGQGGFATVYKGVLQDGREIAVKRLFFHNKQRAANFYNEVNMISSIEHKNLVRLLGCSCSGPESLLVYEFLPNKSLDCFIFDSSKGKELNWEKRFEIIIGTAEGLVFLHENPKTRIVHRDIKASNVLLDLKFRAKIADFGLARSFQEDKSHISTAIAGTLGYMAPEYLAHGQLTEKADVYSFGVLLLEIVTGRQNNRSKASQYSSDSSLTVVWKHFQQLTVDELFDPNLMLHKYHSINVKKEILRVVHVGLLCTQEIPSLRPSMSKAIEMLVMKEEQLPTPTNPPYIYETIELNDNHPNPASIATTSQSTFYPR
ncbi:Cysteine-rich receptor-like protein kinase 2 [Abeliophyllum distichum]|uniref:Cysteine-rich receptor-like protein kinase 2 n=1 Tax=Abeliophyllum distichum TaxID=126358 RepID=A0ABD1R9N8_9LAMI